MNSNGGRVVSLRRGLLWAGAAMLWLGAGIGLAAGEPEAPEAKDTDAADAARGDELPASKREADRPGRYPVPDDLPDPARFVIVDLHEEVSPGMASFVERAVDDLVPGDVLVVDINTFGGRVDAAVRIRDALLSVRERGAWAIAYIHPRAISAGALISLASDIIVVSPGASIGAATPITVGSDGQANAVGEKMVSYLRTEFRTTAEARGRRGDIAEAMVDADREVDGLNDKGKLLTLDGGEALEWGIASFEAKDFDQLLSELGYGQDGREHRIVRVEWSWAENLAGFLTSATLSGILMTFGMLGIMIGLYTGGHPLPLAVGGICLGLFFFGQYVVNLAGFEEIILFVVGAGLIIFEVAVPGHIVPGVLGILMVIASLIMGLVSFETVPFTIQWQQGWITRALATVFGSILTTGLLTYAGFRILPDSRLGRRLVLSTAIDERAASASETDSSITLGLIGATGIAESDLRPAGKVKLGTRRMDAVAERGFVAKGAPIVVVAERGFSVVVNEDKSRLPSSRTDSEASPGADASSEETA